MWKYYEVPPWRVRVKLKNGEYAYFGTTVMRRRLADKTWEYRHCTEEEQAEYQLSLIW